MNQEMTRREFIEKSALGVGTLALGAGALSLGVGSCANAEQTGSRKVHVTENIWIPMSDGVKLAARLWLPADAEQNPVPAILEYLPYRKRDGTRSRDETTHPYFAQNGYGCIRVDIRGTGDSEGLPMDEYVKQELDDGMEIIAWLAKQPWCTGKVGMFGKSWGGFNSLQMAARRPPALKAIITHCASDDRYSDDAHLKGGTILNAMFIWGSQFFTPQGQPPDPEIVGDRWHDMWMDRLNNINFPVGDWLSHQHRDEFWQHGSVIDDYSDIECAVYAIGGWADCYSNAVPRLCAGLKTPVKGLIGPWGHVFPHNGGPEPKIDYLNEALRWWDYWLKDIDTGIMDEPVLRTWMQNESYAGGMDRVDGRWVAEETWPSPRIKPRTYHLNTSGLGTSKGEEQPIKLAPLQSVGQTAPRFGATPEHLMDQRLDDVRSMTFDSEPLKENFEILGAPVVTVELAVDKPVAFLSVRLNEVFPDGASKRVTYALLNLTHRDSHEKPEPLVPGKRYRIPIKLDDIAHVFKRGNRLRVSMSTTYWPQSWPAPEPVNLTVYSGPSTLVLPVRLPRPEDKKLHTFGPAFVPGRSGSGRRGGRGSGGRTPPTYTRELGSTKVSMLNESPVSSFPMESIGTVRSGGMREWIEIDDHDPTSAKLEYSSTSGWARGDKWNVRLESIIRVSLTKDEFLLIGEYRAFEHDKQVFERIWDKKIPRSLV